MVLLRLLALEADTWAWELRKRAADTSARARGGARVPLASLQERDEAVVLEVPGRGDDDIPGRVGRAVVARERLRTVEAFFVSQLDKLVLKGMIAKLLTTLCAI